VAKVLNFNTLATVIKTAAYGFDSHCGDTVSKVKKLARKNKKNTRSLAVSGKRCTFATAFGVIAGRKKSSLAMLRWAIVYLIIY